jgi:hypothetical protein
MGTRSSPQARDAPEIPKDGWPRFFDVLERRLQYPPPEYDATVEIVTDDAEGVEAQRLPLRGMTWEEADDVIAVDLGGRGRRFPAALRHFVPQPRHLSARKDDDGMPSTITIVSADGSRTVVTLHRA